MDWTTPLLLLAQAAPEAAQPAAGNDAGGPFGLGSPIFLMMLLFMAFYFLVLQPQRKDQDKRRKMLDAIKETDKVITTGGIYGVVTNVQRDAGRVTLRVDDANGTKIKVSLAAIAQILGDDEAGGKDKAKD